MKLYPALVVAHDAPYEGFMFHAGNYATPALAKIAAKDAAERLNQAAPVRSLDGKAYSDFRPAPVEEGFYLHCEYRNAYAAAAAPIEFEYEVDFDGPMTNTHSSFYTPLGWSPAEFGKALSVNAAGLQDGSVIAYQDEHDRINFREEY